MKDNQPDTKLTREYINFTRAAHLLGYSSPTIIRKLINSGELKTYTFPDTTKEMVAKHEVLALIKPTEDTQPPSQIS